ncbi:MAG TPA: dihydroxy-acid dehydratase [Clostridiaceae bacterium]|nr:dihydroxy-acid dehydratase [Clostridiaceae bacterium]
MMRSQDILKGPEWANVRSLYKASGFTDGELEKPLIAVVNSFNSICPGHVNLSQLTQKVKEGIYAAGGTPLEFGTIGACDGMAMGHKGMQYVLPTREMIANDIEAMIEAHRLDGLVIVGSCDKIVPGMVRGALRVNLPTVFIKGGPALPGRMKAGNPYGGEYIDHSIIQQSEGALKSGEITKEMFDWFENNAVPTIGSCAMLGTANTMTCLVEAMGLSLPGSSTIPAVYSRRLQAAFESGRAVMEMVEKGTGVLDIVSRASIENAIRVNAAIGGSTNAVLHLLAIATEAEIPLDIFELGRISTEVPHLIPMIPAGSATLLDFHESGGVPEVMRALRSQLDLTGPTVSGKTWEETLERLPSPASTIVRSLEDPVHKRGGIAILRGNIAPEGAVTKPSAIPEDALIFTGPAKVYEKEEAALRGIRAGEVNPGEVVVIRNEGPKGGPGMPEMYKAMKLLVGMKLGSRVCLITDGRFSGSNNGCFVGHICPEALDDGPIAYLKDGDIIHVDIARGLIEVRDVDLEERRRTMERRAAEPVKGYLYQYRKNVLSASKGAVIPSRE